MKFLTGVVIGYFALSKGGVAIVCDLDNWPERNYRPHGINPRPLYVRQATEGELRDHLAGRHRACYHKADTLEQLLRADKEVLPPDVYAGVELALLKHKITPAERSLKLFAQAEASSIGDIIAG